MEPLVSVIIPVYNVAPYLREALDSVIYQSYKNLEIIIVDDGSTDGSGSVCEEYKNDARVTVIHQENHGLSNARNAGLDLMKGECVAFLDPDDAFHPEFVEILLKAMITTHADMTVCRYVVSLTSGRITEGKKTQLSGPPLKQGGYGRIDSLRALVDGRLNMSVWNKLYRKDLWNDIRFPDGHNYEDIDTMYRVLDICDAVYMTDQSLYYHRRRPRSITQTATMKNINDRNLAFAHLDTFMLKHIPGIFNEDQLKKVRQTRITYLLAQYATTAADAEIAGELKQQIFAAEKEIGIKNCGIRTKAAFLLFRISPLLLRVSYLVYHPVRMLVWKVTGR